MVKRRRLELETAPKPPDNWRPKAEDGIGITNDKGDNFYVKPDGTLVNATTGQRGSIGLPETVIRPQTYASSFDGSVAGNMDVLNAMTGGILNRFSPTQNARLLYDVANGNDWRSSWMGNNGIVSDSFVKAHPLAAMVVNGIADGGAAALGAKGQQLLNGLTKLKGRTLTYTGVSGRNIDNFPKYKGTIWTSDNPKYGKRYAVSIRDKISGKIKKGQVFKIYGKANNPYYAPVAEDGHILYWDDLPLHQENGKLVLNKNTILTNGHRAGSYGSSNYVYENTPYFNGMSTDDVVDFAKDNGHDATVMKNIDDGMGLGNPNDIINEIVFHPNADVIKAGLNDSYLRTAFNIGRKYNPFSFAITAYPNMYLRNKKRVGCSLYLR